MVVSAKLQNNSALSCWPWFWANSPANCCACKSSPIALVNSPAGGSKRLTLPEHHHPPVQHSAPAFSPPPLFFAPDRLEFWARSTKDFLVSRKCSSSKPCSTAWQQWPLSQSSAGA